MWTLETSSQLLDRDLEALEIVRIRITIEYVRKVINFRFQIFLAAMNLWNWTLLYLLLYL